jgi:sugar/nucleoside kinase (ribokinase family)
MSVPPSLVCLGNLTLDDVVLPDGSEHPACTGGDALYAVLAARAWLASAQMVAPVGHDLPAALLTHMQALGLDAAGLPRRDLPTLRNRVVYRAGGERDWTLYADDDTFHALSPRPDDIPPPWRAAPAFLILAMTLAAQQSLVSALAEHPNALIALDPQEDYILGNEAAIRTMLANVDIFLPSAIEAQRLTGTTDWERAAKQLAAAGPSVVVIKLGAEGCLIYDAKRDHCQRIPAWPLADIVDTTGAGDSFCGGFMAALAVAHDDLAGAARAGTVAASFTVAGYGAEPLMSASPADIRQRLVQWDATLEGFKCVSN